MALWFARSHPDTPWSARAIGIVVVAYALSPIDLVPDFIPVLGYIDDVILLPILIGAAIRLLPQHVLADSRDQAERWFRSSNAKPRSLFGALLVISVWLLVSAGAVWWWATTAGS